MEVSSQLHAPVALPPALIRQEAGCGRSGGEKHPYPYRESNPEGITAFLFVCLSSFHSQYLRVGYPVYCSTAHTKLTAKFPYFLSIHHDAKCHFPALNDATAASQGWETLEMHT